MNSPKQPIRKWLALAAVIPLLLIAACEVEENFPELGDKLAGPVDVATAPDQKHFYILNSDYDRGYNKGSILVVDSDGNKIRSLETPRMGRSLAVEGSRMVATFDMPEPGESASVRVYDLTDPALPELKWKRELECSPLNATLRADYNHFVVTCLNGDFYIGTFTADLVDTQLKKVRDYDYPRRALYIDPVRELVFAFPTVTGALTNQGDIDQKATDEKTFVENPAGGEPVDNGKGPNEVPDQYEMKNRMVKRKDYRYPLQVAVYDIAAERAADFPYRELQDKNDETADSELRWIYFTLRNFDGTPDSDEGIRNPSMRHYRTNFWEARPDPQSPDSFYLSQRGGQNSVNANNVIKVSINADPRAQSASSGACASGYRLERQNLCVPFSGDVFDYERVYGFNGEIQPHHFPGDFEIGMVDGQELLLVNHFRDLYYYQDGSTATFSVAAKSLDNSFWLSEIQSTSHNESYFQLAMNQAGRALTCSFYGNTVLLLAVKPGTDITVIKQIE